MFQVIRIRNIAQMFLDGVLTGLNIPPYMSGLADISRGKGRIPLNTFVAVEWTDNAACKYLSALFIKDPICKIISNVLRYS